MLFCQTRVRFLNLCSGRKREYKGADTSEVFGGNQCKLTKCKVAVNMKTSVLENCCLWVSEEGRLHKHRAYTWLWKQPCWDPHTTAWPGCRLPPKLRHWNQNQATAGAEQTTKEESIIIMCHYGDDRRGWAEAMSLPWLLLSALAPLSLWISRLW